LSERVKPLKQLRSIYGIGEKRILRYINAFGVKPLINKGQCNNIYTLYNRYEVDGIINKVLSLPQLDSNNKYERNDGKTFVSIIDLAKVLYLQREFRSDGSISGSTKQIINNLCLFNNIEKIHVRSNKK